jgi:ADP-heptose:LPS heptosyltransferase
MGDVLVSSPVLDALRATYPEARLEMMVRPGALAMVEAHPALDEALVVDGAELDDRQGFRRWLREVRGRKYDLGLVLWSRFSEAWLLYRAGIPHRVGQDSRLTYSWTYTRRVRVRAEHGDTRSPHVQAQLDYVRAVGGDLVDPQPRLYLRESAREAARRALEGVARPYSVLHVGRGTPLDRQRLPIEAFARIGDAVGRACPGPVVLTGGESEREVVSAVGELMGEGSVSLAGAVDAATLGAVLEGARVAVMNDSGPMHMAAGVGTPTVGLFAMEKDLPYRWGPIGPRTAIIRPASFRCSPDCLKETCPRMACYEDITPEMVLQAVGEVLGGG